MNKLVFAAAVAGAACIAQAETYTWTNSVPGSLQRWDYRENWNDSNGEIPESAPTNNPTADIVLPTMAPTVSSLSSQTTMFDLRNSVAPTGNPMAAIPTAVRSITETDVDSHREIRFQTRNFSGCWTVGTVFTIENPDLFYGYWTADWGGVTYNLTGATAEHTPVLHNISANNMVTVHVPTKDTAARIGIIHTEGAVRKTGKGKLIVGQSTGKETQIHVADGSLTLEGYPADDDPSQLPAFASDAWLWLDANRTDTYTYGESKGDGRTYVTRWNDARGGDHPYAYFDTAWKTSGQSYLVAEGGSSAPYINTTDIAGKTVLDFGSVWYKSTIPAEPTNCWMRLSAKTTTAREVFIVARKKVNSDPSSCLGDFDAYPFHPNGTGIAANYGQGATVLRGDIIVDGVHAGGNTTGVFESKAFHAVSVGTAADITLSVIATDRVYCDVAESAGRTGGYVIAEIIIFNRNLTHEERFRLNRYLYDKWINPDRLTAGSTASLVTLGTTVDTVTVPSGRKAFVPEMTLAAGKLVKKGAGELKIGEVAAVGNDGRVEIAVNEGSVTFGGIAPVADAAPAGNPMLWLKADTSSLTFDTVAGTNYVTRWNDARPEQTTYYAVNPVGDADYTEGTSMRPYYLADEVGDLGAVDFGTLGGTTVGAYLNIYNFNKVIVMENYQVRLDKTTGPSQAFTTTDGAVDLSGGGNSRFVGDVGSYSTSKDRASFWSINGVHVDPVDGYATRGTMKYNVLGLSSPNTHQMTRVGNKQRTVAAGTSAWGGIRIGEWLYYTNHLNSAERRQTEAYLLKRWKGITSQAVSQVIDRMTFGEGIDAVFSSDRELTVKSFATDGDKVVKDGSGSITVPALGIEDGSKIEAKDGVLYIDFDIMPEAVFDFDAQNYASMTTQTWTPEAYDGQPAVDTQMRTNVLTWGDSGTSGNFASYELAKNTYSRYGRAPVLQQYEVRPGVVRPMVYFGGINGSWTGTSIGDTYGSITSDGTAMFFKNAVTDVAEVYTIFGDTTPSNKKRAAIVSARDGAAFARGNGTEPHPVVGTIVSATAAAADVVNGYIATNGIQLTECNATNTIAPGGVNLYTFRPLSAKRVDALTSHSSGGIGGGCRIGEQIGFSRALSDAERTNFTRLMMKKWFNEDYSVSFDELKLAGNASIIFTGMTKPTSVNVEKLSGSGWVTGVSAFAGVSEIGAKCLGNSWTKTTVNLADVTFANSVTVALDLDGNTRPAAGTYSIFQARSLDNVDLNNWNVNVTGDTSAVVTLQATATEIKVSVARPGLLIFVK